MTAFIGLPIFALAWAVGILLLAIFKWDWLEKHPLLYLDRLHLWMGSEYDSNIRKKTILKFSVIIALGMVIFIIMMRNYFDNVKLGDYTEVNAGEAVPLAGGELVLRDWVIGDSITILQWNPIDGEFRKSVEKAEVHAYGEALLAFTGILTNPTQEPITVSEKDIRMFGVPADIGQGSRFNGSWKADHNADADGNVSLAPGESVFLYFWAVLNKDKQAYPFVYVIHDGENYYKVNMNSLQPTAAEELEALNTYDSMQQIMDHGEELVLGDSYECRNLGNVTLQEIFFQEISGIPTGELFRRGKAPEKGNVFMDLVLEIESTNQITANSQVTNWLITAVTADGRLCTEAVEIDIGEQEKLIGVTQGYLNEVHYQIQVPEDAQDIRIIFYLGGIAYSMDYER